ncbi:MFS transporter [Vibrio algarum]|uniref:MFS transporter n=1 Tax=Vibrio algarum TaxID=3020714 RepID=UPI002B1BE0ED|nr:MFS transporter [Vibrio sp. KJ40-1]
MKQPQKPIGNNEAVQTDKLPRHIWFLVISIMFANMANSAYINAIPIYLTKELGVATSFPGILFGITAAIEIPAMLYSVTWAQRFGKVTVMKWGFVVALLFYASMYFSTSLAAFIILQLLNGLFFGIFVGLGITLMQDFAPNGIGKASAIYSNAMLLGTMIGTSSMGLMSQFFGFKSPLLLSLFSVFISLCAMLSFERFSK